MNFQEAQDYLDSLQMHKIKLGLDSMENFLEKVARPDQVLKFVHVAGTNGKGSVSMNIVEVLARAGYRVGLFTSPHLSSVRERFRINDQFIGEDEFARNGSRVREVLGEDMITYFEFTTALGLLWFVEQEVDLVVLETGLGGRLDATNIVRPLVTIITNISMDHEAYLGNDLRSIAYEKAGIIKTGVPLVTGGLQGDPLEVITKRCIALDSTLYRFGHDFTVQKHDDGSWDFAGVQGDLTGVSHQKLRCGMRGSYQVENSSLALAAIALLSQHGFKVEDRAVSEGLRSVNWPGRLEYLCFGEGSDGRQLLESGEECRYAYLLDGAHNPAGVDSLIDTLQREYDYESLVVVWGAMEDKDLILTLPPVGEMASLLILTQPDGERAADPEWLVTILPPELRITSCCVPGVEEALAHAEANATEKDLILVAGSLYLIGEVRKLLVGELVDE